MPKGKKSASQAKDCLAWAENLCSRREYCLQELRLKLSLKELEKEKITELLNLLQEQGFVNEVRYVKAFVHDKSHLQGWGPEKIRAALRAKQLPDTLISEALSSLDGATQQETLRRLIESKRRSVKAVSQAELRAKLIRFALSRGFSYSSAAAVLDK